MTHRHIMIFFLFIILTFFSRTICLPLPFISLYTCVFFSLSHPISILLEYLSVCLYICLSLVLSLFLFISLFVCLSLSVSLSLSLSLSRSMLMFLLYSLSFSSDFYVLITRFTNLNVSLRLHLPIRSAVLTSITFSMFDSNETDN